MNLNYLNIAQVCLFVKEIKLFVLWSGRLQAADEALPDGFSVVIVNKFSVL